MRIVQWAVDPGLENDVYADQPWLYGRFLSSIDTLSFGSPEGEKFDKEIGVVVDEGGSGDGASFRTEKGIPATVAARKKHFLTEAKRKDITLEKGKEIRANFGNGYLDFNEFSLRLPGFHLSIINYWDGQPLRYVPNFCHFPSISCSFPFCSLPPQAWAAIAPPLWDKAGQHNESQWPGTGDQTLTYAQICAEEPQDRSRIPCSVFHTILEGGC